MYSELSRASYSRNGGGEVGNSESLLIAFKMNVKMFHGNQTFQKSQMIIKKQTFYEIY